MKNIQYQQKAVSELVEKTIGLLSLSGNRHTLVFKAPTGSGKTVMASDMLMRLNDELTERPDAPFTEVAYIWIAPNKLHEQSYFKMKNYFTETKILRPMIYDELDHSIEGYIHPGEILFVNWESINKDNAVMVRETELSASLYDITRRTQEDNGIPIIVIIDEEHMFGSRNAKKSEKVLSNICPKVEIRISATPLPESTAKAEEQVTVPRERVIAEQMIKESVILNPALEFNPMLGTLNQQLINLALKKREELADAYRKEGVDINPLLLIQLPNDGEAMTGDDNSVKEEVLTYLDSIKGINVANGKLAIWLSNEKTDNLQTIANPDDITEVLLFKQAIALGWDCPRAAVLLIFRKIESFTFSAQTVGRILRMPEQRFYQNDMLNRGSFVANKLSLNNLIVLGKSSGIIQGQRISDLEDYDFFAKVPNYPTLRVALCDKAILVEGPTDEMVVLYHFMKEYQCHPFAKGIELISVGGTVFKHFALLGAKLKKRIAVITDNDNLNIEKLETKRNLPQEEVVRLFTEKDTSLHTLEPAFVNANVDNLKGLSKLIRGENVDKESAESLSEYMKKHKTEWALKLLEDESYNFNVPQYIMDAINWLIDGEK